MRILGADYLRLRFTDCIYRGEPRSDIWYYLDEADLFGEVHPADWVVADDIVEAVLELAPAGAGTTLYAPLTVGHHVDHQVTNRAAWQLGQRGYRLAFYEDYPYVDPHFAAKYRHTDPVALAAGQTRPLQAQLHRLSPANVAAKIEICRSYGRPLLCTEWLRRQADNTFADILPLFGPYQVGWYHWGLVAGKTQTYMPWGSRRGDPMPAVWQHDVFHPDGRPYNPHELDLVRAFTF